MVVPNRPVGVASGVLDLKIAQCGVTRPEPAKLGGHAVQIQADEIEIRVRGAMCQG